VEDIAMRIQGLTATAALAGLLMSAAAHGGVYLESTDKDLAGKEAPAVTRMWVDGGRMRTERTEQDGTAQVVIFRDQAMYTLDAKSKTYHMIDKATAERLGAQLADARKKMEASMASMPPEQRARVEEMMGAMGGGKAPQRTVKSTGRTETIAGIKCTVWEAHENGKKKQELCAAGPAAMPGGDDLMKTFRQISTMFSAFTQSLGQGTDNAPWNDMEKLNGVPILTREFDEGQASMEMRLTSVRSQPVPAASFEVPAGYTEKKLNVPVPAR
jgi:hypothetical protein